MKDVRISQRKIGAALSLLTVVVNGILGIAYVPIFLAFLTTSEYGVFELVGSLIGYMSVLDLGFSTTLTRFCVRERESGRVSESNLLAMAAIVYVTITLLAVVVGLALDRLLEGLLCEGFSAQELKLTHELMQLVIANCAIVLPGNYFLAIVNSYERFVFSRILLLARYILQFAGVVCLLLLGCSAFGAVAAQVMANLVTVVACAIFCIRALHVRPRLEKWDFALIKELASFSVYVLLGLVFNQVFLKTGQVILGAASGTTAVVVYSLSCKITSLYIQVANSVSTVFLPRLTRLMLQPGAEKEVNRIFQKVGRIQSMLVWGLLVAFILLGGDFIILWAGDEYLAVYQVSVILMIGFSIDLVQNLGIQLLQAANRLKFRNGVLLVVCTMIVVGSIIVAPRSGAMGCATVTAFFMMLAAGPIMNWYYDVNLGIDIPRFWAALAPELAAMCVIGVVCCALFELVPDVVTVLSFGLKVALFASVFLIVHAIIYRNKLSALRHSLG